MVSIIPPQDPFSGGLARALGGAAQTFAQNRFAQRREERQEERQQQREQRQQQFALGKEQRLLQQQKEQARALGTILKATDPERFGNLDLEIFSQLNPAVGAQVAKSVLSPKKDGSASTQAQKAAAINRIADSQVKEILNNFKGPLGEITFTNDAKGRRAKQAIRDINKTREKKLKAIFGDDIPGLDQDELDIVSGFLADDFKGVEQLPGEVTQNEGGFFQGLVEFFRGDPKDESPKKKPLTKADQTRIEESVRKANPNASKKELKAAAEKKAREEGFDF